MRKIIGHAKQKKILARHIEKDKVLSGYLFSGIAGLGKTQVARWFAQGLLCSRPVLGMACGTCLSCEAQEQGRHPDFIFIANEEQKQIGLNSIRTLQEKILLQPVLAKRMVVLVEDAAMCTKESWNGLLKTLEEPGASKVFIFVTHTADRIPLTIRSRLAALYFSPVTIQEMTPLVDSQTDWPAEIFVAAAGRPAYLSEHCRPELLTAPAATISDLFSVQDKETTRQTQISGIRSFCQEQRAKIHVQMATEPATAPLKTLAKQLCALSTAERLLEKHITPSLITRLLWFTFQ